MNSFFKGFFSVFNLFPSSKSYDEIKEEVNDTYLNKVTQSEFLDEMIRLVPKNCFVPYSYYNKDLDSIQVYWRDEESYTQPTANGINLKIAFDTHEVVGVDILNANQLIVENRKPLSLDEQQRFAIWWCLDRIVRRYGEKPIIVNGININETIMKLTGRLFI